MHNNETAPRNILLTGLPRSGTTLGCHLLNDVPDTVALYEPMRVKDFADLENYQAICQAIGEFCAGQRVTLRAHGRAQSKNASSTAPTNSYDTTPQEGALRKAVVSGGDIVVDKPLSGDFTLVVKHVAAFAAIVPEAVNHFPVYALVRNPLAVLASWNSLEHGVREGHVPAAERLDPALASRLAAIADDTDRQLALLGWFFEQFTRSLPASSIIPYENLVASGGRALAVIHPGAADLDASLDNHNTNPLYDREKTLRAGERLLQSDGAYWDLYSRASVEELLGAFAVLSRGD